ncbi:hypothetical protein AYJ54_06585 [Bradyrhizobium centrolobii]|uniref:AMP-dependent synthetase n=1 Tax=Bradyrhizobium centrolobii TaxID=1505087 RepID=A0A176YYM0_9BRAD|nr:class I adenylate-forming enzyme family protein [Bradyrhizobium centrolobii]OAF12308.1 hypothetical protein AYJ54_06585 [Bradyrhizobium centrolobii]
MATLQRALIEACTRFADKTAVEEADGKMTYRQLYQSASSYADLLRRASVSNDEAVIIPVTNAAADIAKIFGAWLAGCVAVPVHPLTPEASLSSISARCRAQRTLLDLHVSSSLTTYPDRPIALTGAGLVIFTSGSSGEPKGVVLRHDRQYNKLLSSQQMMAFSEATRFYMPLQLTFIFGIWSVLLTLYAGGTVVSPGKFEPRTAAIDLLEKNITDAAFVPTMLRLMLAEAIARRSNARIITAGEFMDPALSQRVVDTMAAGVVSIYGLTETGAADFFRMPAQAQDLALGKTAQGVKIRIQSLGDDSDAGELQIYSPNGMVGYLDAPELTKAAYQDEYLKTGDLARRREDGEIEIVGRLKDLISRGAVKIAPAEIDTAVGAHPAVAAAVCVGIPDPLMGECIHVAVVPQQGASVTAEELKTWALEKLGRHKGPDEVHLFGELPQGRTGKSDRLAVREAILAKKS